MYRYVIEHTRWIPKQTQDELDVYAGNTLGRIYRVLPKDAKNGPLPRFDKLDVPQLAAAMDSPNGTQRDMVQQQLVWRGDAEAAADPLSRIAANSPRPAARLQALCTLDLLGKLSDEQIETALADPHAGVRRQAIRLAESRFKSSPQLLAAALKLADDPNPFVAQQLACSLGETDDAIKIKPLFALLKKYADDDYVSAGVMSSMTDEDHFVLHKYAFVEGGNLPIQAWCRLIELEGASANPDLVGDALATAQLLVGVSKRDQVKPEQLEPIESLLAGLQRNPERDKVLKGQPGNDFRNAAEGWMRVADDEHAAPATRVKCIRLAGSVPGLRASVIKALQGYLSAENDPQLQLAAMDALAAQKVPDLADTLLSGWRSFTPTLRAHALDVLLTRNEWVTALLAAIESKSITVAEIDAQHRHRLSEYPNADLRQKAAAILAQGSSGTRAAVVSRYESLLKQGDANQGQVVFQKNCAACHKVHGVGTQVGPDIAAREDKSNTGLLREILDPNRAVDQRFAEYIAITSDGLVKNGILVEETGSADHASRPTR